jgi:hypothetical protein
LGRTALENVVFNSVLPIVDVLGPNGSSRQMSRRDARGFVFITNKTAARFYQVLTQLVYQ